MKNGQLFGKLYNYIMKSDKRISVKAEEGFFLGTYYFLINVYADKCAGLYPFNNTYVEEKGGLKEGLNTNNMNLESVSLIRIVKQPEFKRTLCVFRHEDGTEICADEKFFNLIPFNNVRYMVDTTKGIHRTNPIFVFNSTTGQFVAYILPINAWGTY